MKGSCFGLFSCWAEVVTHEELQLSHRCQMPDYADGHYHLSYTYEGWHMKDCIYRIHFNCQTTQTDTTTSATLTKAGLKGMLLVWGS